MTTARTILCAACAAALLGTAPPAVADDFPWELKTEREVALLGGAGVAFGVGWLAGRDRAPLTEAEIAALDPSRVNFLDRAATRRWSPAADQASDVLVWTLVAAPVGQMVAGPGRERGGRLALIYGETMLLTGGVTYALKNIFARPRPFVYNDDPRIPSELKRSAVARRSWPSGHSANAFAAAVFFGTAFDQLQPDSDARGWVWGGCLAAATTTGVLRYLAGRHYPTDILAGALIGAAAGWLVPRWHETSPGAEGGGVPLNFALGFGF